MKKVAMLILGLAIALTTGACGRFRSRVAHKPTVLQQQDRDAPPPFVKIEAQDESEPLGNTRQFMISAFRGSGLVVKSENYFNNTDQPVILWTRSEGGYHGHAEYHPAHTFLTDSELSLSSIRVSYLQTGTSETRAPSGWQVIDVPARSTVRIQWVVSVTSGHLTCSGAVGGPGDDNPELLQIDGAIHREVRVSQMGISISEATGAEEDRDPSRLYVLEDDQLSIHWSYGQAPQDVFRYGCWWQ